MSITLELTAEEELDLAMAVHLQITRSRELIELFDRLLPDQGGNYYRREAEVLETVPKKIAAARFPSSRGNLS